jgi:hypothetical protein
MSLLKEKPVNRRNRSRVYASEVFYPDAPELDGTISELMDSLNPVEEARLNSGENERVEYARSVLENQSTYRVDQYGHGPTRSWEIHPR